MKKSIRIQISVLLIFIFGLASANLLAPDREFSPVENRNLAQRPVFSWEELISGDFMRDFEAYVTDQFAGRDGWTALKAYAERALGKRENNGVYICGDRLIERFDQPDDRQLSSNLSSVDRLAEKAQVPVYLMLVPSAAQIHEELLPEGAPSAGTIVAVRTRPQIGSVEPTGAGAEISGVLETRALYLASGSGALCSVKDDLPFTIACSNSHPLNW